MEAAIDAAVDVFQQVPCLLGRQFIQEFLAFTQAHRDAKGVKKL